MAKYVIKEYGQEILKFSLYSDADDGSLLLTYEIKNDNDRILFYIDASSKRIEKMWYNPYHLLAHDKKLKYLGFED